jgi:hypothetical protein
MKSLLQQIQKPATLEVKVKVTENINLSRAIRAKNEFPA